MVDSYESKYGHKPNISELSDILEIEEDKIRQCQLIENNLKIQNRNLVQDFLDIEKLLHRKKKEFRLPDTSAIIVPRKAK